MTIGTLTDTYEDEFDRLSTDSTMPSGGNRKPAGELKDDSGTQVAQDIKPLPIIRSPTLTAPSELGPSQWYYKGGQPVDRKPPLETRPEQFGQKLSSAKDKVLAPTWRDLRPDTYVPTEGAPSQQPKPEPKPLPIKQGLVDDDIKGPEDLTKLDDRDLADTDRVLKALKGVLEENKLNDKAWADWLAQAPESSNIEDRRQEPPMDKLEYVARDIWNAYSKAWKSVLGIDNSIPQKMADEDVRKGKVIKPEFGAPGPSGGGTKSGQVIPKEVLEQKQTEQAFKKLGEQLAKKEEDKYIRDAMERAYKDWVADIKGFGEPVKKTYPRDRFFEHEGRIHVTQPADDYFKARAHQQLNEQLRKTLGEEQWNKLLKSNPVDITPLK